MSVLNFISPIDLEKNNITTDKIDGTEYIIGEGQHDSDPLNKALFPISNIYSYSSGNGFPIIAISSYYDENNDTYNYNNLTNFTSTDLISFINSGIPVLLYLYDAEEKAWKIGAITSIDQSGSTNGLILFHFSTRIALDIANNGLISRINLMPVV